MPKRKQLIIGLAALGLAITAISWAYNAYSDYSRPMDAKRFALVSTLVVLCPPSLLSIPFWETEPDTPPGIIIWLVIGVMNAALYAGIGTLVGRSHWKQE
jgi:drug/metabolite transporter (DMT)-like permease